MGQPSLRLWMIRGRDSGAAATALVRGVSTSSPAASLGVGLESSHASMGAVNAAESAGVAAGIVVVAAGTAVESAAPASAIAAIELQAKARMLGLRLQLLQRWEGNLRCQRLLNKYNS